MIPNLFGNKSAQDNISKALVLCYARFTPLKIICWNEEHMAKNTGEGSRKGAVKGHTQVENPKTKDWVKRDERKGSKTRGEFQDVKEDRKPFKGVAKEPDNRRKKA